jgi:paraquat-inducible protein A
MTPPVNAKDTNKEKWLHCSRCQATCLDRALEPHQFLRCGRCGEEIKSHSGIAAIHAAWAFATTGLILMILANSYPILNFNIAGNSQDDHMITGILSLSVDGYYPLAALVFFSAIAAPTLHLLAVWYLSAACILNQKWPATPQLLGLAGILESWNLVPVFTISCMLSVVKLATLGTVNWMSGAIWLVLLSLSILLTIQFFNRQYVLMRWEEAD